MPAEPSPGGATAAANLLLSFCPRQVLLLRNHQPPMAKTKTSSSDTTNALKTCKARTSDDSLNQHKLLLRRSIAAYLHKFGYSGTLSAFQSEAKVDDWGAQSLDLEQIFNKHLETSENPPEVITTKLSKQDPGKEVINKSKLEHGIKLNQGKKSEGNVETESKKTDLDKGKAEDGHEVEESHANPEEKKKKKSKVSSKTPADDIQRISQEVVHEGEGDDINLKLRDKKKKKEKKDNHENVVEAASEEKLKCKKSKSEPQVTELADGSDTQSKDKKKKKHKSLPDAEMMDSLKECSVVNDENGKDPELGETIVKSKEKKKEKRKSIPDSDVSDSKRRGHENGLGIDDKTDAKSNDKKKKKHKLRHDSDQTNPLNGGDENGFDVDRKDSKKRKRLASEEGIPTADRILAENVSVTKKEAVEGKKDTEVITKEKDSMSGLDLNHSKKRKVEKSEEGLINTKGTAPDTKNKEGLTEDGESDKVDANVSKNGKSGVSQNTMKKEQNGSAEPKTVNAFRRVKADEVKFADERLQNNSYWAKDGADTGYGAKAQEVLGQVRGRDFRHEKTKKKRGSYRGGQIDLQSHSIKFNYSDEE